MKISMDRFGNVIAEAVAANDRQALETCAQVAGTYRVLVAAAEAAGVDPEKLEEALYGI